jgi:hypothetical protein
MIRKMQRDQLLECLEIIEEHFDMMIYSPDQLRDWLKKWAYWEEDKDLMAKLYAIDSMLDFDELNGKQGRRPQIKKLKAHHRKSWTRQRAIEIEQAEHDERSLVWEEAKRQADEEYVQMMRDLGELVIQASETTLQKIRR